MMVNIDPDAFKNDAALFEKWGELFEKALPGGWGAQHGGWLFPDGSLPQISDTDGPQDESTLLSSYPGFPPVNPHCFGWTLWHWMPGSEAFYHGYVEACRREYEFITDGNIAMAGLASLLLRTLKIYEQQEEASRETLEALEEEIADL